MILGAVGLVALLIWLILLFGRSGFWLASERDTRDVPPDPSVWPEVAVIVPARNEASVIARSVQSLAAQDYPGKLRLIMVDDNSTDGTGRVVRSLGLPAIEVEHALPVPAGWTGKLWAVARGIEVAGKTPVYLWLTDADIEHAPDTLRALVARAEDARLALVSLMAKLRCESLAERMLIPAFVFFFQLLYPFRRVNSASGIGAAAGGCMLVRRQALEDAGGIASIRAALIDDCALGALLKREGGIWLGLTHRSNSIRRYDSFGSVASMISRSAYAQLRYSPLLLLATIFGMALVYLAPPVLTIFSRGFPRFAGAAAWLLMAVSFQPMLAFYRRSPLWGLALPAIATFYAGCTLLSSWRHFRGRGGMWKGRAQAAVGQ